MGPSATPAGLPIGVNYSIDGAGATSGVVSGPLAPGAAVTIGTQAGAWTASAGNHTVTAVVDEGNRLAESNESNNSGFASFTVRPNPFPDVVVTAVALSPPNPVAGEQVKFSAVVRNAGAVATPANVVIGVGYFIDGAYRTFGTVIGPLAADASVTVGSGTWSATPGDHQLTALVDDVNRFPESNENNNSTSAAFTVGSAPPSSALYAINIDPSNSAGNPSAAELQAIGAQWVRIEWKAERGYPLYDPVIVTYRAAGLRVMLVVDYASVPPKPASNAGAAAWQATCQCSTRSCASSLATIATVSTPGRSGTNPIYSRPALAMIRACRQSTSVPCCAMRLRPSEPIRAGRSWLEALPAAMRVIYRVPARRLVA